MYSVVGCGVRVGGNGGNPKKAESHLRRSESTQVAPGVQGGLFGVQEGAVGSQEVAGKWRCMNDFSQKVEDFSRFFEIGSFRPWRRRRWSRLAERSPKLVSPTKTDKGKWVSDDTRKIRRFSRRTCRPGYWPVNHPGRQDRQARARSGNLKQRQRTIGLAERYSDGLRKRFHVRGMWKDGRLWRWRWSVPS